MGIGSAYSLEPILYLEAIVICYTQLANFPADLRGCASYCCHLLTGYTEKVSLFEMRVNSL